MKQPSQLVWHWFVVVDHVGQRTAFFIFFILTLTKNQTVSAVKRCQQAAVTQIPRLPSSFLAHPQCNIASMWWKHAESACPKVSASPLWDVFYVRIPPLCCEISEISTLWRFHHKACLSVCTEKACSLTSTLRRTVHILTFRICHLYSSNKAAKAARLVGSIFAAVNKQPARWREDETVSGEEDSTWHLHTTLIDVRPSLWCVFFFVWGKCQGFVDSGWKVIDWWFCFAEATTIWVFWSDTRDIKGLTANIHQGLIHQKSHQKNKSSILHIQTFLEDPTL